MKPEFAKNSMLWMIEEIGESIAIIKKKGDKAIMENQEVRSEFLKEMSDILMYYFDTLLRYDVKSEEISKSFLEKYKSNSERNYNYTEIEINTKKIT